MAEQQASGLVADIGGSNVRFALVENEGAERKLFALQKYDCKAFEDFEQALQDYLGACQLEPQTALSAVLGVAGPVSDNSTRLTNSNWLVDGKKLASSAGPFSSCQLVNDFAALAYSLPALDEADLFCLNEGERHEAGASRLVVGPGTGLGAAFLAGSTQAPLVISGEGGHMAFAPVDALEDELLVWFRKKYGRVSIERLLSGRGLEDIYQALAAIKGRQMDEALLCKQGELQCCEGKGVIDRGLEKQGLARQSLELFCALLGSFAGDMALAGGSWSGVYIAGGIVPRMRELFVTSLFLDRFVAKGRFSQKMKQVPVWLISTDSPALVGAASRLDLPG